MRAFRPSQFPPSEGLTSEEQDELEQDRLKNVERYRLRARLGLPLFVEVTSRLMSKKSDGAPAAGSA